MARRPMLSTAAVALCLSGCGGGGGGGAPGMAVIQPTATPGTSTVVPPVAGADTFRTVEYNRMGALDQIRAADGYALGYTGAGVTIGIIDFNFELTSGEVNYTSDSRDASAQAVALYQAQTGQAASSDHHGHAVAATAAARKNDVGIHGVAFDASVLAVDYFSDVNETQTMQGGVLYHVSDPWTYITSHGVHIINTSFGYEASDILSNPPQVSEAYVLASASAALTNGALVVSSAGNAGGANPSLYNLDTISDLRNAGVLDSGPGAYIIAGAVDGNNQIASFSDRAGSAMNYYMVAPGVGLTLPWNGGFAFLSGTSFSSPLIAGAAAILLQKWPNLTGRQLANILFASATDLGAPGVDAIYGHGLLNIAAALQPIGVTTFAVSGGGAPLVSGTGLVLASAFGDAPAVHQALSQVMMLDGFGRDFETDLSHVVVGRPNLPELFGLMEQRLGWQSANLPLGPESSLGFDLRRRPEDGIVPFQTLAGPQDHFTHDTVFRLAGAGSGFDWTAGTGLSLRDGMAGADDTAFFMSLTNGFSPMIGAAPGAFASMRVPLAEDTSLSFGASHAQNQGATDHLRTPFRNTADAAMLHLDHETEGSRLGLEVGEVLETGGFMGSLASGGLKMADRASTAWTTATAETSLDAHWSLKGAFTLAATGSTHPEASLITSIGPVYATSFAFGLAGTNLFRDSDVLSFTAGQPLRAEQGSLTLATGTGRDWTTGGVVFGEQRASLLPSGREFDFETGYRFSLEGWNAGANVAYAVDPDHIRNKNAVLALFTLSRAF
ncbi:MAG TPA: S8 family peptidase [Micropepsaceae bacterium]|nr:S8 family peptidase [Micropepsaceae bacterium]